MKIKWYVTLFLTFSMTLAFSACESSGDNDSKDTIEKQTSLISPSGGTISSDSGAWELEFLPGAVAESREITVSILEDGTKSVPEGFLSVFPVFEFNPHGIEFGKDVTLKLNYEQGDMIEDGIEERLVSFYYLSDDGSLEKAQSTLNTAENYIEVKLPHFSFGIFLTAAVSLVNNGSLTNEVIVGMIADMVVEELNSMTEEERETFIEENSDILDPFSEKVEEILTENPLDEIIHPECMFYQDLDCDGYGNPDVFIVAETAPIGYVENNTDWDDSNDNIYPGNTEIVDDLDNDCNGIIDDVGSYQAGDMITFTLDSMTFAFAYVPGGITFPTGVDDNGDVDGDGSVDRGVTATVDNAYWIGETEVTYELWYRVYSWATDPARGDGQYSFTFKYTESFGYYTPRAGNDGIPGQDINSQEPVTRVNWRHAMVWCNALTEWYNAHNGIAEDLDCVYYSDSAFSTPIRTATESETITWEPGEGEHDGTQDDPHVKDNAAGFRLLTNNEWELAARWRNDDTNTVSGYIDPWFTTGNSASGATTYYDDYSGGSYEPALSANNLIGVYFFYGDTYEETGVDGTAIVKSKTNGANALGLYDMSGNLWEWCFDWDPSSAGEKRVERGGGWRSGSFSIQVGYFGSLTPTETGDSIGFRIARSAQ